MRELYERGDVLQLILSDANTEHIGSVLRARGLDDVFASSGPLAPHVNAVTSNPAFFDELGRLHIAPFHSSPPGCARCPPNLCKGVVMKKILQNLPEDRPRIIYVGDGMGDLCSSMLLGYALRMIPF